VESAAEGDCGPMISACLACRGHRHHRCRLSPPIEAGYIGITLPPPALLRLLSLASLVSPPPATTIVRQLNTLAVAPA
jgi:hypothetical protein